MSVVYKVTKGRVDMLTKSMAVELGLKNIRVDSTNPIIIETPISKPIFEGRLGRSIKERVVARTPPGRIAELEGVITYNHFPIE